MKPNAEVSHIAYSDESYYTSGRYRSVSVVTFAHASYEHFSKRFRQLLDDAQIAEFKWNMLRRPKERIAAMKLIDTAISLAAEKLMRLDVLIWDTQDSRHQIEGRDDIANLQRMYYHLFKNVLKSRWPTESTWLLMPDENSALDWQSVQDYLDTAGLTFQLSSDLFDDKPFHIRLSRDFQIVDINQVSSEKEPVCQLADLFAGIGAYSHSAYARYCRWVELEDGHIRLITEQSSDFQAFTKSEKERFQIIRHLDQVCKRNKFRVSLKRRKGFKTFDPRFPINFWVYEPQSAQDKAPIKRRLTKRALDVWDSATFSSIFLASGFSYISNIVHARPHAGNANRWVEGIE